MMIGQNLQHVHVRSRQVSYFRTEWQVLVSVEHHTDSCGPIRGHTYKYRLRLPHFLSKQWVNHDARFVNTTLHSSVLPMVHFISPILKPLQ